MTTRCEMCESEDFKYRCPKCEKKTCSLSCSKKHTVEDSCNGIRDKTRYIAVKDFNTLDLLSDYRLLEGAAKKADGASRDMLKRRQNFRPRYVEKLVSQCRQRNICLKTLPYPMTKRKVNRTKYFDREKEIHWLVEWIFPQSEVKYLEQIKESQTLREVLSQHVTSGQSDSVLRPKLQVYSRPGLDNVRLFMKVEGRPADSVRYYELNKDATLANNLTGKTIVEYPTIHVVLSYCALDFTLLEDAVLPSPKATTSTAEKGDNNTSDSENDSSSDSADDSSSSSCGVSVPNKETEDSPPDNKEPKEQMSVDNVTDDIVSTDVAAKTFNKELHSTCTGDEELPKKTTGD